MLMTPEQLRAFDNDGYLFLPNFFSQAEVDAMKVEIPALMAEDSPRRILEKDGELVRSVYGSHTTCELFNVMVRHPRILEPAMQFLGSEVYVYQFKINAKSAFGGDVWEWHQDYLYWRKEDNIPTSRMLTAVIYLDEVTEFNGPMFIVPRTHKEDPVDVQGVDRRLSGGANIYQKNAEWITTIIADIKYPVGKREVTELINRYGVVSMKGPVGSTLFFHSGLLHASTSNISPFDRAGAFVTYNSIENLPPPMEKPRPEFLASRDSRPLKPVSDDELRRFAR